MLDGEAIQRRRVGAVRENRELTAGTRLDRIADRVGGDRIVGRRDPPRGAAPGDEQDHRDADERSSHDARRSGHSVPRNRSVPVPLASS